MRHRSQPSKPPQVGRTLLVALLVPHATACGDETPPEKPGSSETQADAGGPDASTWMPPDASCVGARCDAGPITESPDAGATDAGPADGGPEIPPPLTVDLSAPSELLVRSDGSAALRVGVKRREGFTGPVTLALRGLPPELFVADRQVSQDTSAAALVVSVSERVGPGTRLDATLVATADGRSTSRPLRLLVSGPSFSLDPTFPVVPLGWKAPAHGALDPGFGDAGVVSAQFHLRAEWMSARAHVAGAGTDPHVAVRGPGNPYIGSEPNFSLSLNSQARQAKEAAHHASLSCTAWISVYCCPRPGRA